MKVQNMHLSTSCDELLFNESPAPQFLFCEYTQMDSLG